MAMISFRCKNCGKSLRIGADRAGRKVRCPACEQPLTVPDAGTEAEKSQSTLASMPTVKTDVDTEDDTDAVPNGQRAGKKQVSPRANRPTQANSESVADTPAPEDESGDQRPRGKSKKERSRRSKLRVRAERSAWRKVLLGLSLLVISMLLTFVAVVVGLIAGLFGAKGLLTVSGVIGFALQGMALVGYALCLAVPPKHYARIFAAATLILALAGLAVDVGSIVRIWRQEASVAAALQADADDSVDDDPPQSVAGQALDLVKGFLVDYGRHITFVLFLWAVAQMYEGNDLDRDATKLLALMVIGCVMWIFDSLLSHALGGFLGLDFLCGWGWQLIRAAMLSLFLRLLYNTLIVLQSKATGEPVERESDRDSLRHLPIERPEELR